MPKFNMYVQVISPSTGAVVAQGYSTDEPFEVETEELAKDELAEFIGYVTGRQMSSLSLFRRGESIAHEVLIGSNVLDEAIFEVYLKEVK